MAAAGATIGWGTLPPLVNRGGRPSAVTLGHRRPTEREKLSSASSNKGIGDPGSVNPGAEVVLRLDEQASRHGTSLGIDFDWVAVLSCSEPLRGGDGAAVETSLENLLTGLIAICVGQLSADLGRSKTKGKQIERSAVGARDLASETFCERLDLRLTRLIRFTENRLGTCAGLGRAYPNALGIWGRHSWYQSLDMTQSKAIMIREEVGSELLRANHGRGGRRL
ncbi:hypothetical protein Sjap_020184 [Stephania japonica]|uniref:Uncharacterized protein n=1 Tax=Stephania japonica TaxID=461633 RepID=A0AAP0I085_9MAGN